MTEDKLNRIESRLWRLVWLVWIAFILCCIGAGLAFLALTACPNTHAGTISVAWDAVDTVAYPEVDAYRVYHGPASGTYDTVITVPVTVNSYVIETNDCAPRYIGVKALATATDEESASFNTELVGWPVPEVYTVEPQGAPAGIIAWRYSPTRIRGTNFQDNIDVVMSGTDAAIYNVIVRSCGEIFLDIDMTQNVSFGYRTLSFQNPDGGFQSVEVLATRVWYFTGIP